MVDVIRQPCGLPHILFAGWMQADRWMNMSQLGPVRGEYWNLLLAASFGCRPSCCAFRDAELDVVGRLGVKYRDTTSVPHNFLSYRNTSDVVILVSLFFSLV